MDERARTLLKTLVEHYIADGQPVEITHTWCRNDYYDFMVELFT